MVLHDCRCLLFAPWPVTCILAGLGSRQNEVSDLIQNTLIQPPVIAKVVEDMHTMLPSTRKPAGTDILSVNTQA